MVTRSAQGLMVRRRPEVSAFLDGVDMVYHLRGCLALTTGQITAFEVSGVSPPAESVAAPARRGSSLIRSAVEIPHFIEVPPAKGCARPMRGPAT